MRFFALVLMLSFLAGAAAAESPTAAERLDRFIPDYIAREHIPGLVVVALRGDQIVLRRTWGFADPASAAPMSEDAVQPFYSVAKQFTAAIILRLAEEGRVDIEAPAARYLPEPFAHDPALTVAQLLRHTSGLQNNVGLPEVEAMEQSPPGTGSLRRMLDVALEMPRRFPPGSRHAYSNTNYTALALLAERVTGEQFDALQQRLLFRPLGLDSLKACADTDRANLSPGHDGEGVAVTMPPNLRPSFTGAGGVCGTAVDLALWTRALGAGRVVAAPALADAMRRGASVSAGYTPPYGLGLSTLPVAGQAALSHGGAGIGWGAWVAYLPQAELTVVVLANRGWFWGTDVGAPVVRALLDLPEPPPLEQLPLTPLEQATLSGAYEDGLFRFTLTATAEAATVAVDAFESPILMWKQADGSFVAPERPDTFVLRETATGIEFDWAEHRSYLVPRRGAPEPAGRPNPIDAPSQ